jgi:hypothetical protein
MNQFLLYFILLFSLTQGLGQSKFQLPENLDKVFIPFELLNNMIIIPVEVNGTELNFILDTGVSRSIIFNLERVDSIDIRKKHTVKIFGYGEKEPFEVYYSNDNKLNSFGYTSQSSEFLIMINQSIDLFGFFGLDVHGIIGYDFFSEYIIEIDYKRKALHIHRHESRVKRKLRRMKGIPLIIKARKPYIETVVQHNGSKMQMNTLVDTGNGDAMWLLPPLNSGIKPTNGFKDKLGVGLSGNVKGNRSKINQVLLGKYKLNEVTVSIPDEESLANRKSEDIDQEIHKGSIGGEILKRFKVFFDYKNILLYLKPQSSLKDGFYYNMAGLDLMEGDLEIFTDIQNAEIENLETGYGRIKNQRAVIYKTMQYYMVGPKLIISYVRPDSPAELSGLKIGDVVLKVNGRSRVNLTRNKIVSKFFEKPYSTLRFEIQRNEKILKFKFKLIPLI